MAAQAIFFTHSRKKTTIVVGLITVIIACFPFVFSQILPLLTYAGLLVVPVGGIVFAEHQIFPRIRYTRYWSSYRNLTFSTPAVASWGLGLVFGFGLNAMNVMSFFYLFIPTWIFTILIYTFLAGRYGAKRKYPEAEQQEKVRNENIAKFQEQKAKLEKRIGQYKTRIASGGLSLDQEFAAQDKVEELEAELAEVKVKLG